MAVMRDRPYCQFNFLIDLGTGATDGPQAGFQEVSAISTEVAVTEYRNGNSKESSPMKITGLNKATDVDPEAWRDRRARPLRLAQRHPQRQPERAAHGDDPAPERGQHEVVQTCKLLRARIVKHTSGPFNARASDVAIEEIVLAYERLDLE